VRRRSGPERACLGCTSYSLAGKRRGLTGSLHPPGLFHECKDSTTIDVSPVLNSSPLQPRLTLRVSASHQRDGAGAPFRSLICKDRPQGRMCGLPPGGLRRRTSCHQIRSELNPEHRGARAYGLNSTPRRRLMPPTRPILPPTTWENAGTRSPKEAADPHPANGCRRSPARSTATPTSSRRRRDPNDAARRRARWASVSSSGVVCSTRAGDPCPNHAGRNLAVQCRGSLSATWSTSTRPRSIPNFTGAGRWRHRCRRQLPVRQHQAPAPIPGATTANAWRPAPHPPLAVWPILPDAARDADVFPRRSRCSRFDPIFGRGPRRKSARGAHESAASIWRRHSPSGALGYTFDIVLRGSRATPMDPDHA